MWKDPELGRLLEGRLTKQSYDLYHDSIGFINETMDDLGEELGLNDVEFRSRLSTSSGDQVGYPRRPLVWDALAGCKLAD